MKQVLLVLTLTLLVAVPNLGSALPQPPTGHPQITPTYPEHLTAVEPLVRAVFDTISGPKGQERDWDKFRELFFEDARLYSARLVHEKSIVSAQTVEQFILSESSYLVGSGYFETPVNMKIEQFGQIAHVRSVYESRRLSKDADPYTRGVYSIQLVQRDGRWWILNMLWQAEHHTSPIPEEFLK